MYRQHFDKKKTILLIKFNVKICLHFLNLFTTYSRLSEAMLVSTFKRSDSGDMKYIGRSYTREY